METHGVTDRLQGSMAQSVIHALITRQKYESRQGSRRGGSESRVYPVCVSVATERL